jgi:hypothetical protein
VLGHWHEDAGWWHRSGGAVLEVERTDLWRVEVIADGGRGIHELVRAARLAARPRLGLMGTAIGPARFAHLRVRSTFSLRDATIAPERLAVAAAEAGMSHVALTDRDGLSGAVRFVRAAAEVGVVRSWASTSRSLPRAGPSDRRRRGSRSSLVTRSGSPRCAVRSRVRMRMERGCAAARCGRPG